MKVRSQVYPTTNIIPIDGGHLRVVDEDGLFDSSHDTQFVDTANTNGFTYSQTGTVTASGGGEFNLQSGSQAKWTSASYDPSSAVHELSLPIRRHEVLSGASNENFAFIGIGDGSSYAVEIYIGYDTASSQYTLLGYDLATGTQKSVNIGGLGELRLILKENNKVHAGFVRDGEFILVLEGDLGSATSVQSYAGLNTSLLEINATIGKLRELPILDIPCRLDRQLPQLVTISGRDLYYDVYPAYPGVVTAKLWGTGVNLGQSATAEVVLTDQPVSEDSMKFVVSPVETLYDDAQSDLRCREFGVEDEDFRGDIKLHTECKCDGSLADETLVEVEIVGGTKLGGSTEERRSDDKVEFVFEEAMNDGYGSVRRYGESFAFQRLHEDLGIALDTAKQIKQIRTEKLSNGDRIYYGILHQPMVGTQNIEFGFNSLSSPAAWEIGRADTGQVIASGTDASLPADQALAEGVYYYTLQNADGEVYWNQANGEMLNAMPDMTTRYDRLETLAETPPGEGNFSEGLKDHKLFFEVKQYHGQLVVWHYSRCNGTVTTYVEPNTDISLRSDSLAAVETLDGNVAFIYESMTDHNLWGNRSTDLNYKVLDLSTGTFTVSNGTLTLPDMVTDGADGIYAFDAVRVDDEVHFLIVFETDGYQAWSPTIDRTPVTFAARLTESPLDFDGFQFQSGRDQIRSVLVDSWESGIAGADSLETLYERGIDHQPLFTENYIDTDMNHPMRGAHFGYVRAQYDGQRDEIVVSMLNYRHRAPMIVAGKNRSWKEISVPRHFDFYSGGIQNLGHDGMRYTYMNSLSACYGTDGMVYSVATKSHYGTAPTNFPARTCEVGVSDPEVEEPVVWIPNDEFDPYNPSGDREFTARRSYAVYRDAGWRFQTVPVWNLYQQSDGGAYGPETAHITRDDGYLVATLGLHEAGGTGSRRYPMIYQNCTQDEMPFEVPLDEAWSPAYRDETNYTVNNLLWGYTDGPELPYAMLQNGDDSSGSYVQPKVSRVLDGITMREQEAKIGYRFALRVQRDDNADTYFQNNFVFEATAVKKITDDLFTVCKCRMVYNGSQIDCRVWNNGSWKSVGTICDVGFDVVRDLNIIVQHHDATRRFRAMFVVKEPNHANSDHQYDFRSSAVVKAGTGLADIELLPETDPVTEFSCYFDNPAGPATADIMRVYEMGWNVLGVRGLPTEYIPDYKSDGTFANGDSAIVAIGEDGYIEPQGDAWRDFDDVRLFGYEEGNPLYAYRMSETRYGTTISDRYHWPNGFEFYFSGRSGFAGDRWTLDREVLSNTSDIQTSRIHGYYTTKTDDTAVHIWADSQDSGLGDFEVDTFIVTGVNVPEVTIVGKDSLDDPWTDIATIDLRKYVIPPEVLTEVNHSAVDRGILKAADAYFKEGRFSEFTHYVGVYKPTTLDGIPRAGKITTSFGDTIWSDIVDDLDFSARPAEIFVDRAALVLDTPIRHRFVGIRIDPYNTYEGKFIIHSFDFGRSSVIPLRYSYDAGSGASQEAEAEINFVFDEQPYSQKKFSLRKEFDLTYSLTDAATLSKAQATVREVGVTRKPVWILENNKAFKEKVYQCFIDGGATYTPLLDEDGKRYYEFEVTFRSSE